MGRTVRQKCLFLTATILERVVIHCIKNQLKKEKNLERESKKKKEGKNHFKNGWIMLENLLAIGVPYKMKVTPLRHHWKRRRQCGCQAAGVASHVAGVVLSLLPCLNSRQSLPVIEAYVQGIISPFCYQGNFFCLCCKCEFSYFLKEIWSFVIFCIIKFWVLGNFKINCSIRH